MTTNSENICKAHDHPDADGGEFRFYGKPHKPVEGLYDGKPRKYCAYCNGWLEPAKAEAE